MTACMKKGAVEATQRWFKNHVATLQTYTAPDGDTIQVLDWSEPGTNVYHVRYVFDRNFIMISGDIREAVFCLTEKAKLERVARYDFGYFFGKLSCCKDEGIDFDRETALAEIEEYMNYFDQESEAVQELRELLVEKANECGTMTEWSHALAVLDNNDKLSCVDTDWWESVPSFGAVYSITAVGFHTGLKMAYAQLKERGEL